MTPKEKEQFNELRVGFNLVKESNDHNVMASRRVEIARPMAQKLLKASFYLNAASIACFTISLLLTYMKPPPNFYGSMPNGKIFPLATTKLPKR
jgi:hypothetical protein